MAKPIKNPNGAALRGPQLAPATAPEPEPVESEVGQVVTPPETTITQIRGVETALAALKVALADVVLQSAALDAQRLDLVTKITAASERYLATVRAAAAGSGINLREQRWTFDGQTGAFTRTA